MTTACSAFALVCVSHLSAQTPLNMPLSRDLAEEHVVTRAVDRRAALREARAAEWEAGRISIAGQALRFKFKVFGTRPDVGRSLFISLHGGGETSAAENDNQWETHASLYTPYEGVYLTPRAPSDAWNMWHQGPVDGFIDVLIENAIVFEDVNPDRVYLLGYSAGGDGVYQLAPRLADRFAAAAMMAGHPNESQPTNLANVPFAIWVGENDNAFKRNSGAREWAARLDALAQDHADLPRTPPLYTHVLNVVEGAGHWMNGKDAAAFLWMKGFTRESWPKVVRWKQDDVTRNRLYWLGLDAAGVAAHLASGGVLGATVEGNEIRLDVPAGVPAVTLYLSDKLLDLDRPIRIRWNDSQPETARVQRSDELIASEIGARLDVGRAATAMYRIERPMDDRTPAPGPALVPRNAPEAKPE